jgi:hypothetical protein
VKERPILFSAAMVRAILEGHKTQTRRTRDCGDPGDRLWVRETFSFNYCGDGDACYFADLAEEQAANSGPWKPSIFMPRDCSRILLEIVSVRHEFLQDISAEDAIAEGVESLDFNISTLNGSPCDNSVVIDPVRKFSMLWDSINAKRGYPWAKNPFVWAITFKRLTP